jgi:eukaryotic-like serine/threonine-protein kinase
VGDGVVYVGSSNTYLYALDTNGGELKWRFKTEGGVFSTPAVAEGVVYVGSNDGYLYAVEAESNGQENIDIEE